jgi:GH43 family beta-xylosidase
MENPWTLRGPQVRLTQPKFSWECEGFLVNEGAAVLQRNGRVFISYSASATDHRYCMGLLWADQNSDLLDPNSWHKASEPVFASDKTAGQWGPGHNSFTTSLDCSTDILVYHARPYKETFSDSLYDPNRQARMQTFGWSSEGMPIFGAPVVDGVHLLSNAEK